MENRPISKLVLFRLSQWASPSPPPNAAPVQKQFHPLVSWTIHLKWGGFDVMTVKMEHWSIFINDSEGYHWIVGVYWIYFIPAWMIWSVLTTRPEQQNRSCLSVRVRQLLSAEYFTCVIRTLHQWVITLQHEELWGFCVHRLSTQLWVF